jgi:hypothetical protein
MPRNRCRHFTGVGLGTCAAGVSYQSVKDTTVRPYRFPCSSPDSATRCAFAHYYTADELAAQEQEMDEAARRMADDLKHGRCPECHQPVERRVQVGRCVYGEPCGHRLYQGRA